MIRLLASTGSKTLVPRGIMRADGSKVALARVGIRTATGDIDLWTPDEVSGGSPLAASASPPDVVGYATSNVAATVFTNVTVVSVTGAVGAVTYSWSKTSGAAGWSITNPGSLSTSFSILLDPDVNETAVFEVTATDSLGRTATATVGASASNFYYGGY